MPQQAAPAIEDLIFNIESAAAWHADMHRDGLIPFWVVQGMLPDYPRVFVARAWAANAHGSGSTVDARTYNAVLLGPTVATLRALLPPGMLRVERAMDDDWTIVERWVS